MEKKSGSTTRGRSRGRAAEECAVTEDPRVFGGIRKGTRGETNMLFRYELYCHVLSVQGTLHEALRGEAEVMC